MSRQFIDRDRFERTIESILTARGEQYQDNDTIYGDLSRLVVAFCARETPDRLRELYNELGWKGEANGRAIHEAAKAWMAEYRNSEGSR